jgi:hypothetical protein
MGSKRTTKKISKTIKKTNTMKSQQGFLFTNGPMYNVRGRESGFLLVGGCFFVLSQEARYFLTNDRSIHKTRHDSGLIALPILSTHSEIGFRTGIRSLDDF